MFITPLRRGLWLPRKLLIHCLRAWLSQGGMRRERPLSSACLRGAWSHLHLRVGMEGSASDQGPRERAGDVAPLQAAPPTL